MSHRKETSNFIQDRLQARAERDAEMRGEYEPAPQRPPSFYGPRKAPAWAAPALVLVAVGALVALFQETQPAPLAVPLPAPTAAPGAAPALAPPVAAEPSAEAPTAAPAPPPIEEPAPPQAAPMAPAPAPIYVPPPPPTVDIFANPSELQPLPAEGWHPPLVEGAAVPTPDNFVMRREP